MTQIHVIIIFARVKFRINIIAVDQRQLITNILLNITYHDSLSSVGRITWRSVAGLGSKWARLL